MLRPILLLLLAPALLAQPAPEPKPKPKPGPEAQVKGWLGVGFAARREGEATVIEVNRVWGESPAYRGGLRQGDLILALDGEALAGEPKAADAAFREHIAGLGPGAKLKLKVRRVITTLQVGAGEAEPRQAEPRGEADPPLDDPREWLRKQPPGARLRIEGAREARTLELVVTLGRRPGRAAAAEVPTNAALRAAGRYPLNKAADGQRSALAALDRALRDRSDASAYADLQARLAAVEAGDDPTRLELVRYVHRDAHQLVPVARQLADDAFEGPDSWTAHAAFRLLEAPPHLVPAQRHPLPADLGAMLRELAALLVAARAEVERAFAGLSAEERAALPAQLDALWGALDDGIYLFPDLERKPRRRARTLALLAAADKVDVAAFERALGHLGRLRDPALLAQLRELCPLADQAKPIVAQLASEAGLILIGGTGPNVYRKDAALIIDLGGDDIYQNNVAGTRAGLTVAAIVDAAGDDAYESHERYSIAAGVLGVGLLVDHGGDDSYVGKQAAIAVGVLGAGLLIDRGGDDSYRGLTLTQGVGCWGAGLLVDRAGADRYEAQLYAQGLGLPGGVGWLHDQAGADRYYAKGLRPTGYGTRGVFDAWSQGCGLGFRLDRSGGIGLLTDGGGDDRYEAGNFAQGGGYYYGWGLLVDRAGNDRYLASRYGQGWSAHQACGTFLELAGDDRYRTRNAVIAGLAWDQAVTAFVDYAGDDDYRGGGFSLGASAHNSICLWLDAGGRDRYAGTAVARSGPNSYHGGSSWSLWVDAGGEADVYERPGKPRLGNDRARLGMAHRAFLDLPGPLSEAPIRLAELLAAGRPPK